MRLAIIIDKEQTFQLIAGVLYESLSRGHECTLFCNFNPENLGVLLEVEPKLTQFSNLQWVQDPNKSNLIQQVAKNRDLYDAVIGINLFNTGWRQLYQDSEKLNYSLEYCWNEIYNQVKDFKSGATLFCNTDYSKEIISNLSSFSNLICTGSPWFEFLTSFSDFTDHSKKITFLAPHNSLYIKQPSLAKNVEVILFKLREWCNQNGYELVLKSRQKYHRDFKKSVSFDKVVSDTDALSHILLYASSQAVIHFCSSAVNELAFLQTPYLCLAPDFQKQLHTDRIHAPGIQKLHDLYYSGDIFDGRHCDALHSDEMDTDVLVQKLEGLLSTKKDWKKFQQNNFPGKHEGAAARILDLIETDHAKAHEATNDKK